MNDVHGLVERLRQVDLNLLVSLQALLEERSVTRAGARLGITQSATSHALKRLREVFEDPLLVRGRGELLLTPRAEVLAGTLRSVLRSVERTLNEPGGFDPSNSRRSFRLAAPDLFDTLVLPDLLARIAGPAPFVSLDITPFDRSLSTRLERAELDLAVQTTLLGDEESALGPRMEPDLIQRRLFVDRFSCFVRPRHPILRRRAPLTVEAFAKLDHVLVSPTGRGPGVVDDVLEQRGLRRRVRVRVPQFATALAVVTQSDLVLTAPSALTILKASLRELKLPFSLPRHVLHMAWHPRDDSDLGHRWLRRQLLAGTRHLAARLEAP
ncbi:MAG: LysR family transcriptional regulator [Myxococcota bacterium]